MNLTTQNGTVLADSREVAEVIDKRHANLVRDIEQYKGIIVQNSKLSSDDYFIESHYISGTGKKYKHFLLTKIGCDMVANKMTGQKGVLFTAEYTKRFEEMEHQLQEQGKPSYMIEDPVKRAEKWIQEEKEKQQLEYQQKLDEPYTKFGKAVSNSNSSINVGAFAKMMYDNHGINIGRNKLFAWLRDNGYLIKSGREKNQPKQLYLEQGLFDTSVTVINHNTKGDLQHVTPLVTGKGQVKLGKKLIDEFEVTA